MTEQQFIGLGVMVDDLNDLAAALSGESGEPGLEILKASIMLEGVYVIEAHKFLRRKEHENRT